MLATMKVGIIMDGTVQPELRPLFEEALTRALERRPGVYRAEVRSGPQADEIRVWLHATHRRAPLPLFFPRAHNLEAADVLRIVGNVIEGMGPAFAFRST